MSNVRAVNFAPIVPHTAVDAAIHDALHKFVGRGKRYSVKRLWNESGVKDRNIEAAMAPVDGEHYRPLNRSNLFSIMAVLGADFANEILPVARLGAFDLPKEAAPHPGALVAEHAQHHAGIAHAAADGVFCLKDRRTLRTIGRNLIENGMALVGLGSHQQRKAAA